jgi:hypothetical protein
MATYRGSYFAQPQPKKRNGNPHKKETYYVVEHLGRNAGAGEGRGSRRPQALKITRF